MQKVYTWALKRLLIGGFSFACTHSVKGGIGVCMAQSSVMMSAKTEHEKKTAFFDVDHTITRGATAVPFAVICAKRKMIKKRYFLLLPIFYIMYRFFSIGMNKMKGILQLFLPSLKGVKRDVFLLIGHEAFETKVRGKCYRDALEEIRRLRQQGARVVLATSSPFEAVVFLARSCGIPESDIISSRFHYENDVFDGRLDGIPPFSEFKRNIVFAFMRKNGIDPAECSFYSDSAHDIPLLEAVGRAVAVNPDRKLKKEATKRGWEIRRFR